MPSRDWRLPAILESQMRVSEDKMGVVETQITYVGPGAFIDRWFVAPSAERNTGKYQLYRASARDGQLSASLVLLED
jgi:hypothetical protein